MAVRQKRPEHVVRLFAEAYLANGGQVKNAAIAAGVTGTPKSLEVKAARLHKRARVSGLLEQKLQQIEGAMGKEETLLRLSRQARADIGRHLSFNAAGVSLQVSKDHTDIIREYVEEEVRTTKAGETLTEVRTKRLKVADPVPSLQTLAKIHGLEKPGPGQGLTVNGNVLLQVALDAGIPREKFGELGRRLLAGLNGNGVT